MPEGWAWASLSEIANLYTGNSINENEKTNKYSNLKEGLFYIATKDIDFEGKINYNNGIRIPLAESKFKIAPAESTLLCIEGGSAGRKIGFINQSVCFVNKLCCFHSDSLSNLYLFYYLQSKTFKDLFNSNKNGLIGGVSLNLLKSIFVPVAPIIEQDIISETIKTYLEKISSLDTDKETLEVTIKKAKAKILDLAIHGKLVPQDANDEPASVLLEKLRAEKEDKISKGELKRDKNDSYIYKGSDNCYYEKFINGKEIEAEIPFDIPDNWSWCKIKNLTNNMQYGTSEKSQKSGKVPVLRMGNITREGNIDYSDLVYTSNEKDIKELKLQYNDILFNRTNSIDWVGKTAIFKENFPCICAGYIISFTPNYINPDFLNYVMNSSYQRKWCNEVKTDGVNQSNINSQKLADFYVPFPPIREQLHIVNTIENLFSKLDNICMNLI